MGEVVISDEIGVGERAADLTEDRERRDGACPGIGILQKQCQAFAGMRMRDGPAEGSPEPFIGPNLMHLLWFVSGNVIGAVAPRAGASR